MRVRDSDRGPGKARFIELQSAPNDPQHPIRLSTCGVVPTHATTSPSFFWFSRPGSLISAPCPYHLKTIPNVPQAISPMHAHSSSSTVHTAQHPNIARIVSITVPKELEEHENHVHRERKGDGPSRPQQKTE